MREGKNDEMPCGNTIDEREYDGGGSYTTEEEEVMEWNRSVALNSMIGRRMQDPEIFWEAIGLDGAKNGDKTAQELASLLTIGNEKSLLAFGEMVREQIYRYVGQGINEDIDLVLKEQEGYEEFWKTKWNTGVPF